MRKKILITTCVLMIVTVSAQAQWDYGFDFSKAGTAGLQFLKIGIGARESAMGEAAISTVEGINAIFWNPAGIASAQDREVAFTQNQWLLDIQHSAVAAALRVGNIGVLGLSVIYLGLPEFEETTVQMQDGTGRMVSASDMALGIAFARRFTNKLAMGGQVKYVQEKLDSDSFSNVLLDIGALYHTGFRNIQIGVSAQHFGPDIKMLRDKFRMPLIFKVGISDNLITSTLQSLRLGIDLVHPTDNTERMNFGLEYGFAESVFIRSGYRMNSDLGKWSFGAGLAQNFMGIRGRVDYAYTDYGEIMGGVNRITFILGF